MVQICFFELQYARNLICIADGTFHSLKYSFHVLSGCKKISAKTKFNFQLWIHTVKKIQLDPENLLKTRYTALAIAQLKWHGILCYVLYWGPVLFQNAKTWYKQHRCIQKLTRAWLASTYLKKFWQCRGRWNIGVFMLYCSRFWWFTACFLWSFSFPMNSSISQKKMCAVVGSHWRKW